MPTAADQVSVDAMLADAIAKMDALTKRMDALEVGEKKIIKGQPPPRLKSLTMKRQRQRAMQASLRPRG